MLQKAIQAPIRLRLPVMIAGALICSILVMSAIFYLDFKRGIEARVAATSVNAANQSVEDLKDWFAELSGEVDALSTDRTSAGFMARLNRIVGADNGAKMDALRTAYVDNNPFPKNGRDQLNTSPDGSLYDFAHAEFHSQFQGIAARSAYFDLFFISPSGDVLYSVYKRDEFGTNLLQGEYAQTGLSAAFRDAVASRRGDVSFSEFAPYAPGDGKPAGFLAKTMKNERGEAIGVVAIQMPLGGLSETLKTAGSLGPSDEMYVLGEDGLARTESREPGLLSMLESPPALTHLGAVGSEASAHFHDVTGIRGTKVDAFVREVDVLGNTWMVVVERDAKFAFAPLTKFLLIITAIVVVGTVMAVVVGYFLARSVTRPLADFSESMKQVADGDLNTDIDTLTRKDEFGQIASDLDAFREKLRDAKVLSEREARESEEQSRIVKALSDGLDLLAGGDLSKSLDTEFSVEYEELRQNFNATVETMNELMQTIVENSNEIHARAEEISASSDDLSHRTENQAATLEETAAALDELTASVREAADSASEVEGVVTEARKDAEESGVIVSQAVDAMSMIRKSSSEISQIIGVIDDIAFQTNLLSLNAGVEAARAGEAGRGFAVVASEVRALAQRSSEAAKQIKSLITSSSEQVETGVGLVGRTGEALGSIIERVSNIDDLVSGIATGSREQSSGLGEINIGMSQLDQVTQQNAAMVEEATAAASTLRNEAGSLTQVVGRFKLKNGTPVIGDVDSVIEFKVSRTPQIAELDEQFLMDEKTPLESEASKQSVNAGGWTDF